MQKPHWSAWCARNASCRGVSGRAGGERLDRPHVTAVRLHGEDEAAPHRDPVEPHGARAAHAVLAADVRARETERVPQEVGEEQTRLDLPRGRGAR